MDSLTEGLPDFNTFMRLNFEILCKTGRELAKEYLERADGIIKANRDTKRYRLIHDRCATIKTIMGEVSYRRGYYKDQESRQYVFLLDEALGVKSEYGQFSGDITEMIINECLDKSYRKSAESVSEMTGQRVTAMGAWGLVQKYGEMVRGKEKRLVELAEMGAFDGMKRVSSKVLFEEMDGVWVREQKEKRGKEEDMKAQAQGNSPSQAGIQGSQEEAKRKRKWRELRLATAYTGWKEVGKGRYETVNKTAYAGFEESGAFHRNREGLMMWHYETDEIEQRVVNGDGAKWIKSGDEDAIRQLDPYHRSQMVVRSVRNREDRKALFDVIAGKNADLVLMSIQALHDAAKDEKERKRLKELLTYFTENKDILYSWDERGIELAAPPEGIVYRRLGTQEHSNCDIIAQRMKHRKGSWTENGAVNMAKALCSRATVGIQAMLAPVPEFFTGGIQAQESLSAAKAPKKDGKGDVSGVSHGSVPLENAFLTAGREAIRNLLRHRPISEWAFK